MKLLLTSVFGPFGVDDEYGRADNKMELFHNQVTREQGIFSYRFHHPSFGLYFLAENLTIPTTVLDFPNLETFTQEIMKGYDYIGISFIIPNFLKAKKMTELIREHSPQTKIILGGHGTNIPKVESLLSYDHLCRGEGVAYLRKLFNEDVDAPIRHPLINGTYNKQIMGVSVPNQTGIIISGVGCANKCRFCATSHFFGNYTAYLKTGQDVYDLCCRYEDEQGVRDFGIMDENFLKDTERAKELVALMEKNQRYFSFAIFSSAETLGKFENLDFLVRLGINFIWMGVESKREVYEKNQGTDFPQLVKDLRSRGISVMTSVILFQEHHDKETIWEDIDFACELNSDYVQFMQLGPIPGTKLYEDYLKEGKLLLDIPFEEQHGQDKIWFKHPSFSLDDSKHFLIKAFQKEYEVNGASFVRMIETSRQGYQHSLGHYNPHIRQRAKEFKKILDLTRPFYPAVLLLSPYKSTKKLIRHLIKMQSPAPMKTKGLTVAVTALALKEQIRIKLFSDKRHPPKIRTQFNLEKKSKVITPKKSQPYRELRVN